MSISLPFSFRVALVLAGALTLGASAGAQETYTDSIPGTLIRFEMVKVPGANLWVGRTEVTWDLYDAFALSQPDSIERRAAMDAVARPTRPYGAPDYGWGHAGFPVISVAFTGAEAFCAWLSTRTGKKYRLPSDDEWDLIAREASRGQSLDEVAWHAGNSSGRTHAVGQRKTDAAGLSDLFGNAAEWVVRPSGRPAVRGGSFRDSVTAVGPAARAMQEDAWNERDPQIPQSRWWMSDAPFAGFRIVREP